jgi:hypothetical protein
MSEIASPVMHRRNQSLGSRIRRVRRSEARHREIAGDRARAGRRRFQHLALGLGAAIVPKDGGTQDLVRLVQQDSAVHLSGQSDAAHLHKIVIPPKRADGCTRGAPPIFGILFAPERVRVRDRERRARLRDHRPRRVEQDRLNAGGAEIEAKLHGVGGSLAHWKASARSGMPAVV